MHYLLWLITGLLTLQQPMETVTAQAVLRPASGRSLTQAATPVTAAEIEQYRPARATVSQARKLLSKAGFTVSESGLGLSISAPKAVFERTFGTPLQPAATPGFYKARQPLAVPPGWRSYLEAVVLPEPPEVFR